MDSSSGYTDDPRAVPSMEEIRAILDGMAVHWNWMSFGQVPMQWDLIRVQLPQLLSADAFPDWPSCRTAVAQLALQQVGASGYDADGDGVVDAMFVVASSGDLQRG